MEFEEFAQLIKNVPMTTLKKKIWLLAVFIGIGNCALAQNELPACPTQGFKHNCIAEMVSPEGDRFALEFQDGKPNEQGKVTVTGSDGRKFVGQFKMNSEGQLVGQGDITWPSGVRYVGQYRDGKLDGQGVMTFPNGNKYVGVFKDNKAEGQGTMTYADGQKYVGEFKNDKLNGQGIMTFPNGNKYVGQFKDDEASGRGILTFSDGQRYVGEFRNDKLNGQGIMTFPNGNRYVGQFEANKANGQGMLSWADGSKYVGTFKDDQRNGQGIMTFPNGNRYVGNYIDNKANGQGVFTFQNGNKYIGQFKDDMANGQGTLTWADGTKYIGTFWNDKRDGHGIEYRSDGSIFSSGIWKNDIFSSAEQVPPRTIVETQPSPPKVYSEEPPKSVKPMPSETSKEPVVSSTGTGFFVSSKGYLITNAHVVEGCKSLFARRSSGETFAVDLVASDAKNDLALLKSSITGNAAAFRRGSAPLGTSITVYGFPLAGTLAVSGNLTTGSISALAGLANDPSKYQISAPVQPGNSGGSVLDESGLVVGVVQSKLNALRSLKITGDIPQNINFAIKSSVAQNFLDAHGVKYTEKSQTAARKASSIADDAMHFTVLIACIE